MKKVCFFDYFLERGIPTAFVCQASGAARWCQTPVKYTRNVENIQKATATLEKRKKNRKNCQKGLALSFE